MSAPTDRSPALAGAGGNETYLSTPEPNARVARRQSAQLSESPLGALPPHSDAAERGALGCILLASDGGEDDRATKMIAELSGSHFYSLANRAVFSAVSCLDKRPPTTGNVVQWLTDKGQLQGVGGLAYVSSLPDAAPIPGRFDEHLATLKDKAKRRALIQASARLERMARDEAHDPGALSRDAKDVLSGLVDSGAERKEHFRFHSPSDCRNYTPSAGLVLVGDFHITRGSITVIAGPPGVGKSRTATALALAGAKGCGHWLGLPVRRHFRTAILQAENGRHRLRDEFAGIDTGTLDEWIRISEPPPFGVRFDDPGFRSALAEFLQSFPADVVILDPWNSAVSDDKQRDYAETFRLIKGTLPKGEQSPALVIVAHTKKPSDTKRTGRSLMFDVSGSHMIASVPRSLFVLQPASDDPPDDRVVWTNPKNNDGPLCPRTAWHRREGRFDPCEEFDWKAFDGTDDRRRTVTEADLRDLFNDGKRKLARKAAATELSERTKLGRSACYDATDPNGRFKAHLNEERGLIGWKA